MKTRELILGIGIQKSVIRLTQAELIITAQKKLAPAFALSQSEDGQS